MSVKHCQAPVPGGCLDAEGNPRKAWCAGLCVGHDSRKRRGGRLDTPLAVPNGSRPQVGCAEEGCPENALWKGYCSRHYRQMRRKSAPKAADGRNGNGSKKTTTTLRMGSFQGIEVGSIAHMILNGNPKDWKGLVGWNRKSLVAEMDRVDAGIRDKVASMATRSFRGI